MYFYTLEKMNMNLVKTIDQKVARALLRKKFEETGNFATKRTKHGSYTAFNIYQCRCSVCVNFYQKEIKDKTIKANNERLEKNKKIFKETGELPQNLKHGRNGYHVGCRCNICTSLTATYQNARLKKLKAN